MSITKAMCSILTLDHSRHLPQGRQHIGRQSSQWCPLLGGKCSPQFPKPHNLDRHVTLSEEPVDHPLIMLVIQNYLVLNKGMWMSLSDTIEVMS